MTAWDPDGPIKPDPALVEQFIDHSNDTPRDVPPRERFTDRRRSRATTNRVAPKPKAKEPPSKKGEFIEPVENLYSVIAMGVSMADIRAGHIDADGNPTHNCGEIISSQATAIAEAWDDLAQKNDGVRRMLRKITTGGAWAGVIGAHLPIAMALARQHAPGSLPKSATAPEQETEPTTAAPTVATESPARPRKRTVPRATPDIAQAVNERRSA